MISLQNNESFVHCIKMPQKQFTQILLNQKINTKQTCEQNPADNYMIEALSNYLQYPVVGYHDNKKTDTVYIELSMDVDKTLPRYVISHDTDMITGLVAVSIYDIINGNLDEFLDMLSMKLTNTYLLNEINYELVGTDNNNNIIFRVTGDATLLLESED